MSCKQSAEVDGDELVAVQRVDVAGLAARGGGEAEPLSLINNYEPTRRVLI
jgi:hypothetical protein